MTTTEKWVAGAGQGLTWGTAMSASVLNALASGKTLLSDIQIDNSVALDNFADVSVALGSIFVSGEAFIGIYYYPLNDDGTTYGDGRFATAAFAAPDPKYCVGSIGLINNVTQAQQGTLCGIILPPGKGKFLYLNMAGNSLAASATTNTFKYRTYNRSSV